MVIELIPLSSPCITPGGVLAVPQSKKNKKDKQKINNGKKLTLISNTAASRSGSVADPGHSLPAGFILSCWAGWQAGSELTPLSSQHPPPFLIGGDTHKLINYVYLLLLLIYYYVVAISD